MKSREQKAESRNGLVLFLLILLIGCETREHADAELDALKKAKAAAAKASSRASSQDLGVAECDAYIRSYESCLNDKVPEEKRDDLRRTLNEQRRKWQDAIGGGGDTAQVAEQCKSAQADAVAKMGEYGCTF